MREDPGGKHKEKGVAEDKSLQEAMARRTRSVWRAMLIWTGVNLLIWVVWWLYGEEFKHNRMPGPVALSFWLIFTGFVWAQVGGSLLDYLKLEKHKKLLKEISDREQRENAEHSRQHEKG